MRFPPPVLRPLPWKLGSTIPMLLLCMGSFAYLLRLVHIVDLVSSIHAGLQGQEAGNTLADILWGAVNPSGRLPYTIAKSPSDYSADIGYNYDINYSEGLYIDYRWFDEVRFAILFLVCVVVDGMTKKNITPRFEFGFGLSYTSFSYSAMKITRLRGLSSGFQAPTGAGSSLSGWSVFRFIFERHLYLSSIC